ncbi:hypothetical protein [Allosphingosinicella deserti]|uniref:hypothetical protein n=1 Tax=Allosphingosinicella deserti TaxID=2116704 RepID=UPI001304C58C|nr:hypothetical protein [Sphingomonas deserti]
MAAAVVENGVNLAAPALDHLEEPIGASCELVRSIFVKVEAEHANESAAIVPPASFFRTAVMAIGSVPVTVHQLRFR